MRGRRLVLFTVLVCIAAGDASHRAAAQQPATQAPPAGPPPRLFTGTLIGPKGPMPSQWLAFVGSTNRCPDTCSCDTGGCSGGPECEKKLCVHGIITRTNSKGAFGIFLRPEPYDVHLDGATGALVEKGLNVGAGPEPLRRDLIYKPAAPGVGGRD